MNPPTPHRLPRRSTSDEVIFGWHAVTAVLEHAPDSVISIRMDPRRNDQRSRELQTLATRHRLGISPIDGRELDRLAGSAAQHQGVMARVRPIPTLDDRGLDTFMEGRPELPGLILALDQVQDPHNFGACLRSAAAAGVALVIIPEHQSAGLTPTVRKVACGGAERIPIAIVTNLVRALRRLKELGMKVVGGAGESTQALFDADLTQPTVLVVGSEEDGMRRLTREACDYVVKIPMPGRMESLNVSVAAGIMMFEAVRQRQSPRPARP